MGATVPPHTSIVVGADMSSEQKSPASRNRTRFEQPDSDADPTAAGPFWDPLHDSYVGMVDTMVLQLFKHLKDKLTPPFGFREIEFLIKTCQPRTLKPKI